MTDKEEIMKRVDSLEEKVDRLLILVERANGAWLFAKWFSACSLGLITIWTFVLDHIRWK